MTELYMIVPIVVKIRVSILMEEQLKIQESERQQETDKECFITSTK